MKLSHLRAPLRTLALGLLVAISAGSASAVSLDHHEFEASIYAPFRGVSNEARDFKLYFSYMDAADPSTVAWKVEILNRDGSNVLRQFVGEERLFQKQIEVNVPWNGRDGADKALASGFYKVRMTASSGDPTTHKGLGDSLAKRVDAALAKADHAHVQEWEIHIGTPPKIAMPDFRALPTSSTADKATGATGSLPYTIYYGNLHGQSNDSDGGGNVSTCSSSQSAQSGQFGPTDAWTYADSRGLDFLLESEHNHYFDGSSGTNTGASPTTAINRYAAGVAGKTTYSNNNPGFVALYGMEWGVISNGGHLNIVNADKLAAWEYNSSNQLLGDIFVAKNDYASLYTTMRARGWIGQFNHPDTSDQFKIGTTVFGYHVDGEEVMVAAEILNTSAFSNNTTETETGRSTYEGAFNKFLENGFRVAPTTNQDNHCANWGASWTNRTGILIPTGTSFTQTALVDAMKARRVFASSDKNSQIILTANGNVMGSKFNNSGALNLVVLYANSAGRSVSSVQIYEGVPRRGGTVTLASSSANFTTTPSTGDHFYYAKITQDDGKVLWSAPVWVTQGSGGGGGDTTAPTVSASEAGTSGTITLSATASDNVGVTNVEFYIDNVLRGSDNTSPYSITFNSANLANGSHSLTAKAYDAASNVGTSTAVNFSISNTTADTTPPTATASESGTTGTITLSATAADNIGVSKVEFYIDNVLRGTDTTSPYSITFNSTALTNGSHSLTAKAYDAANNIGTSSAVNFTISNSTATEKIVNGGFESGTSSWTATSGVITNDTGFAAYAGTWKAWLNGYGATHTDSVYQTITIPSTATSATLTFYLDVATDETTTTQAFDTLKVQVRNSSNTVLATLATYSNLNAAGGYSQKSFSLAAYKGQTIRVYFLGVEGSQVATSFVVDNVSVMTQ
ncbi:Ig-like domain-containing protein [Ahniella affigens]|uniref:Ig-like domain-containing protein n=1 Tax=Ahniella affigens TaxID=2021234 RepID=UPI001F0CB16B|nr:Ig-like domain-containing protein [Ahniella affigens]